MSPTRTRRRFTTAYKLQILEAAAQCTKSGDLGALLRREGLYSSHLSVWRAAAGRGELTGVAPRRGPKPVPTDPHLKEIADLKRQLTRATARAERLALIVDLQKKWRSCWASPCPRATSRTRPRDGDHYHARRALRRRRALYRARSPGRDVLSGRAATVEHAEWTNMRRGA